MSVGLTPKFTIDLGLEQMTDRQFLVIAIDLAKSLNWTIGYTSDRGLIALAGTHLRVRGEKITIRITGDIANIRSESLGSEMIDLGRNKKNAFEFANAFDEIKNNINPEELAQKYEELAPGLTPPDDDILSSPPPTSKQKVADFFSIFVPREGFFITPILVDLNISVFLLMILSGVSVLEPSNHSLVAWGANIRSFTLEGQWWRLITNCFLHIGVIHLLLNMYALLYIGLLLEPHLGRARFATAYLLTGIAASVTSLYWHELTISAGASGAIFGMYGVFLAMLTTNLIEKEKRNAQLTSIAIFVVYNLVYGMKGGIDNAAHIGGLCSGLIIGYIFYPGLKTPGNSRLINMGMGISILFVLVISTVAYKKIPNDIGVYEKKMERFGKFETAALSVYKLADDASKEKLLSFIKDSGLYYWNENIKLLHEVEKLQLPASVKKNTPILISYCNERIDSYNYMYRKIAGFTGSEEDSIPIFTARINGIMESLNEK